MQGNSSHPGSSNESTRRRFIWKGLLALGAGLIGKRVSAAEAPKNPDLQMEGDVMHTSVFKGRPPIEPLDTMIRFERSDDNNGRAMTHEILSLMHEEKGKNSYPWTIYAGLSTHHEAGDGCVLCSRLHKHGPGWSAGLHSEVFTHNRAVGLGVNVEMSNDYTGPEESWVYGINIMACGPQPCLGGLVIKNNGSGPGAIFKKQISLESNGPVGIDLPAKFETGLNMHGNTIRVDEGTCIELDGKGQVKMRYKAGRIEFLNGDKCVGHLDMKGDDHGI